MTSGPAQGMKGYFASAPSGEIVRLHAGGRMAARVSAAHLLERRRGRAAHGDGPGLTPIRAASPRAGPVISVNVCGRYSSGCLGWHTAVDLYGAKSSGGCASVPSVVGWTHTVSIPT
jgi:hypothetical protein